MQAKVATGNDPLAPMPERYEYETNGQATFITGVGIANRQQTFDEPDSDSEDEEDKLLREADKHKEDFCDLFRQMNEMKSGLEGDDIYYMKQMRDIQGLRIDDHLKQYDRIQNGMVKLADESVEAM